MEILKARPYWAAHTPPPWDFNPMSHDTCKNFHQDSWVAFKWNNFLGFFKVLTSSQGKMKTMLTSSFFFFFSWGEVAIKVYYEWRANGELPTLTECNFIESCIWQCGTWNIVHPLRVKRSTKTAFWSNRRKFIFHFFMILLPHWYRLGFWISCCGFQIPGAVQVQYLTIVPRARMAS